MAVTRCVCHQCAFTDLVRLARLRRLTTVAQLTAATRAGSGCGSCRPYLAALLATGATCFAVAPPGAAPVPAPPDPRA